MQTTIAWSHDLLGPAGRTLSLQEAIAETQVAERSRAWGPP